MSDHNNYPNIKRWRIRKKIQLISLFGGRCAVCDGVKSSVVYDFHHVNPEEKEGNILEAASRLKIAAEAAKCVLVCSNCHRELHAGIKCVPVTAVRVTSQQALDAMPPEPNYRAANRLAIPDDVFDISIPAAALKYGVSESTVTRWRRIS